MFRTGLIVLGLLSVGDLASPLVTDGEHPPTGIALVAAGLGVASIVLIISAWRGARRALVPLFASRVLSAATAVPAFFVQDVPSAAIVAAVVGIVLTVLGIALVRSGDRRTAEVGVR